MNQLLQICAVKYAKLQEVDFLQGAGAYTSVKFLAGKQFINLPIVPGTATLFIKNERTVNGLKYQIDLDFSARSIPEQLQNLLIAVEFNQDAPQTFYVIGSKDLPARLTLHQKNPINLTCSYDMATDLPILLSIL